MNAGRLLAWAVFSLVGLVLVGMLAIWLFKALLGLAFYIIVGALVVGGGMYLYRRVKRSLGPGARERRRIEAATRTYRDR